MRRRPRRRRHEGTPLHKGCPPRRPQRLGAAVPVLRGVGVEAADCAAVSQGSGEGGEWGK